MPDDAWTTLPPPLDLAALFPEMAHLAPTTTRLHPRVGAPTVFESSMGAKPLWPADEPWPTCTESHDDAVTDVIAQIPVTASRDGYYVVDSSVLHPEPGMLEYPRGGGYPYENTC